MVLLTPTKLRSVSKLLPHVSLSDPHGRKIALTFIRRIAMNIKKVRHYAWIALALSTTPAFAEGESSYENPMNHMEFTFEPGPVSVNETVDGFRYFSFIYDLYIKNNNSEPVSTSLIHERLPFDLMDIAHIDEVELKSDESTRGFFDTLEVGGVQPMIAGMYTTRNTEAEIQIKDVFGPGEFGRIGFAVEVFSDECRLFQSQAQLSFEYGGSVYLMEPAALGTAMTGFCAQPTTEAPSKEISAETSQGPDNNTPTPDSCERYRMEKSDLWTRLASVTDGNARTELQSHIESVMRELVRCEGQCH